MTRFFAFAILYFSLTLTLHSQTCNTQIENRLRKLEDVILKPEMKNNRAFDSLKTEATAIVKLIESCTETNSSYSARGKLSKISVYYNMAALAGLVKKYDEMLKYIEFMEKLLPTQGAISESAAGSFTIDGKKYTAKIPPGYVTGLYYQIMEKRVNYYYFYTRDYAKIITTYEKILQAPSSFKPASLEALLYVDAMKKTGKPSTEYFKQLVRAGELFAVTWNKKEEHDSSTINNHSLMLSWFRTEVSSYNIKNLNESDPTGNLRLRAAKAVLDNDDRDLAKKYAISGAENGANQKSDGFWYLDVLSDNEPVHVNAALTILEKSVYAFTESELNRMLPIAEKNNKTEMARDIRERLRKLASFRKRTTISLVPSVELIGLPFGHVPVSLNLRTGRIWSEFRFDYVYGAKTKYRFGMLRAKGSEKQRFEFTGWDVGYAFGYFMKQGFRQGNKKGGRSQFYASAFGFDVRYANWNFAPITTNIFNPATETTDYNVLINAKTNRYEFCFRTSLVYMTRFVTLDYYMGLGIGYRTLTTAEGRNVKAEEFSDSRLFGERWNRVYMPLRLGLKVGFNIL